MRIAIYTVDGTTQIVLTPEGKFEEAALGHLHDADTKLTVLRGQFYECRGGWFREASGDNSTILRVDRVQAATANDGESQP